MFVGLQHQVFPVSRTCNSNYLNSCVLSPGVRRCSYVALLYSFQELAVANSILNAHCLFPTLRSASHRRGAANSFTELNGYFLRKLLIKVLVCFVILGLIPMSPSAS